MLRQIPEIFPGTPAAEVARTRLKDEVQTATAQRIRLSRGFLLENPNVAGPRGLALAPGLLDGDVVNGELHPEGVTLIGGREVEVCTIAPGGDDETAPQRTRDTISAAHLARLENMLRQGMERGEVRNCDPARAALLVSESAVALMIRRLSEDAPRDAEEDISWMADTLLHGLSAKAPKAPKALKGSSP